MKINKVKINSYGKLKNKEINLEDNLNIIYGKNESGKSTLLKFILNIFYGASRNKKGKDISDFEYTPHPDYKGPFHVYNEATEELLLRRFYTLIEVIS